MKKALIGLAAAVVAIAGAFAASVPLIEEHAAQAIKTELERDGTAKVDRVEVGLFDRSVVMENLRNDAAVRLTASRWSASGLSWPLGEILRGRLPFNGLQLGDPLKAARVEASGLELSDLAGNTWSFGRLLLQDIDLARYDTNVGNGPSSFSILGARLLRALSVGHFEEHDVTFAPAGSGARYSFGAIAVDGVQRGRLGSIAVTDFAAFDGASKLPVLSVSDVRAAGVDFGRILGTMSSSSWTLGAPVGRLGLDKLSATGFGGSLMARYGISLGSVSGETTRKSDAVQQASSKIEGFVLAPPLRGLESLQMRLVLTAMGLRDIRLGFECMGTEDRAKEELTVDRCTLTSPDLAELDFSVKFVDADETFWHALDSGDLLLAYDSKVAIGGAKLVLSDRTLLDRSIKAMAATSGQPAAAVRSQLAQEVRRFQPPGVLITDDLTKLLDTVARFVERGGTLTLEAKPDPAFALQKIGYLATPGPDLVSILGITARLSK